MTTSYHFTGIQGVPDYWQGLPAERYERGLGGMNVLILRTNGKLIGMSGLLVQAVDHIVDLEIGYSILPEYWQTGYATEAAVHCKN